MKYINMLIFTLFFQGCNQPALKTASMVEIRCVELSTDRNYNLRNINILDFKNDVVNFDDTLSIEMSRTGFDGEIYFRPQRNENLLVVNNHKALENNQAIKDIYGVRNDIYLDGEVVIADFNHKEFDEDKINYKKCEVYDGSTGLCKKYETFADKCNIYGYELSVHVKVRALPAGDILMDKQYKKDKKVTECMSESGDKVTQPILSLQLEELAQEISNNLIDDLLPKYKIIDVPFIETEDIYYTQEQKNILKNAIEVARTDLHKAVNIFKMLVSDTKSFSSTSLYNLGLVYEALGDIQNAKRFYFLAERIMYKSKNINPLLLQANKRVNKYKYISKGI